MQNNTTTAPLIQADRILIHGYVITMDPSRRILRDGAAAIHGGKILAVGATEELLKKYTGSIYDCGGGVENRSGSTIFRENIFTKIDPPDDNPNWYT